MKIAIDVMGGDFAPTEAIKGVGLFLSKFPPEVDLILVGDKEKVKLLLSENGVNDENISILHTDQVIGMHEHPTKALKEKKQSSIALGFQLLATGKADAFISAGNTGAMMVGALYSIKAIQGVLRPAIGAYLPRESGHLALMLDVGLNADCKPENLSQFAVLGSLFAKHILNIPNPRVGLINLGEEEGKGNLLTQAAYPILKQNTRINFIGNVEGRDLLPDKADIYVCDGFTGNVILKFAESIYDIVERRHIIDEHFNRFNFEIYGGVPVLGVNKPVIIGHGISHAQAFDNMIQMAKKMHEEALIDKITNAFL
jgi:glycerol-3-phosphate acyltransferase PlsX